MSESIRSEFLRIAVPQIQCLCAPEDLADSVMADILAYYLVRLCGDIATDVLNVHLNKLYEDAEKAEKAEKGGRKS